MAIKRAYDYVYLTNTPSFYKLNLCKALAKDGIKGLLVFYGYGSEAVNRQMDNSSDEWGFDFAFLHSGSSHERGFFKTFFALLKLMRSIKAKKIIYSGWLAKEYVVYSFLSPKSKNVMVVESTVNESTTIGKKGWLKRKIMKRMAFALPSGKLHVILLDKLNFKGDSFVTGSVGILNKPGRPSEIHQKRDKLRYLYLGRLIECKNVEWMVQQFNKSGRSLSIVGKGHLEESIKKKAKSNVKLLGFIDNEKLPELMSNHDVLVLPSKTEPWGLVVEEAIYFGIPVIVSDKVGSAPEMVEELGTGMVFSGNDGQDFEHACTEIEKNYVNFANACFKVDFELREQLQINAYKSVLCR